MPDWLTSVCLQLVPIILVNSGLAQYPAKEFFSDVSLMRVGNSDSDIALNHELMLAARVGTGETQLPEESDEIFSLDRSKRRHHATSLTKISIPSMAGNGRFL